MQGRGVCLHSKQHLQETNLCALQLCKGSFVPSNGPTPHIVDPLSSYQREVPVLFITSGGIIQMRVTFCRSPSGTTSTSCACCNPDMICNTSHDQHSEDERQSNFSGAHYLSQKIVLILAALRRFKYGKSLMSDVDTMISPEPIRDNKSQSAATG